MFLSIVPNGNKAFVYAYTATTHMMAIPADSVPETWVDMHCFAHTQAQLMADKFNLVACREEGLLQVGLFQKSIFVINHINQIFSI